MEIAILSNVNIDLAESPLKKLFGEDVNVYKAGFNQYVQELMDPNSEFYRRKPEIAILHLEGFSLFSNIFFDPFNSTDIAKQAAEEADQVVNLIIEASKRLPSTFFIVSNLVIPPTNLLGSLNFNHELSLHKIEYRFNDTLFRRKQELQISNFVILDWRSIVLEHGFNNIYDQKYWYLGRIPYNKVGFELLAGEIFRLWKASKGKVKKVIVLDLDNTLWGGIIGEDGIEGIKIGEDGVGKAYRDFQRLLKSIKNKGVVLAIASKNNEQDVREVFENHPMMVLKLDDFVAVRINWLPKSHNIKEIAKELNLGIDSFVFIDDNPAERLEIKEELPDINVPEFPEDPVELPYWFLKLSRTYFDKLVITHEDKLRSQLYKGEAERHKFSLEFKDMHEFLKKLGMRIIVTRNHRLMIPRIAQLTQRTNQFNLTTRRYTEADIRKFMESGNKIIYDVEVIDKFGSNGIVGVIIVELKDKVAYFDVFLLSCRVIGRDVEEGFVWSVSQDLTKTNGIKKIVGEYIPTKKNQVSKDTYKKLGFTLVEKDTDGKTFWEMDMDKEQIKKPDWLKIEENYG